MRLLSLSLVAASLTLLTIGCASAPERPPTVAKSEKKKKSRAVLPEEDCVELPRVQAVLSKRDLGFQDCYADGLALDASLQGTVTLELTIPPSGLVDDVRVSHSDLGSQRVESCILEVARGLTFEQETCRVSQTLEYPVRLRKGSSEFALR